MKKDTDSQKLRNVNELTVEELEQLLARRRAEQLGPDLNSIEEGIEEAAESFKQSTLSQRMESLGPEENSPKSCPRCGRRNRVRSRASRTLRTLAGQLHLERNYHYCEHCRRGYYPRDHELALPEEGEVSLGVEKRIADFGVTDTYEEAAQRWSVHYRFGISENLVRQVVDRVGRRVEASEERYLQYCLKKPEEQGSELLLVQTDGSMVPTRQGWKEAKVAVIARTEHCSGPPDIKRGLVSEARYLAVVGGQEEFKEKLDKSLKVDKAMKADKVVWIADGALGNWRLAYELAPGCEQVLDWYHAVEHASDCGKMMVGDSPGLEALWLARIKDLLSQGEIELLLEELMECVEWVDEKQLEALNDLIRYYRNNQRRMDYQRLRQQGIPIANGTAESAHRHVLQVRMKRAGQRWSLPRARRMARLRAAYRTAGPRKFYDAIRLAAEATRVAPPPEVKRLRASNR